MAHSPNTPIAPTAPTPRPITARDVLRTLASPGACLGVTVGAVAGALLALSVLAAALAP